MSKKLFNIIYIIFSLNDYYHKNMEKIKLLVILNKLFKNQYGMLNLFSYYENINILLLKIMNKL